ncbi:MAG: methyltransferase domain-containing protein [Chloroflexota bacterium]|nr:methyltransferase domain-containing protein [Chloroflexota bacterium]
MAETAVAVELRWPGPGCGRRVLAVGTPARLDRAWRRAGWQVDQHALDLGPAADLAGRPFTPPVRAWPHPDAVYDAVIIHDQLAHVVDDEAAIAEAARVLRPGGRLLLRVPRDGPLAWLDSYNLYRYLRDFTKRGASLPETRGIGWRRHYPRRDLNQMLSNQFRVIEVTTSGIGLTDLARLISLVLVRWLLGRNHDHAPPRSFIDLVARVDDRLGAGPFGYHLLIVAERTDAPASGWK